MKKFYLLYLLSLTILLFGSSSSKLQAQVSFGDAQKFNKGWLFTLGDENSAKEVDFSDSKWRNVDLSHDWTIEGELSTTLSSCTGYLPGGILF
ncbi:MAG: hypothetical protein R3Y50_05850 [Rikenellaceae bacterium]